MLSEIEAGDEILTVGGIYGIVQEVDEDDDLIVEIADGIHVRVARRAVATVVKPEEDDEDERTVTTTRRRGDRGRTDGGGRRARHRARRGGEPGGDTETPVPAQVSTDAIARRVAEVVIREESVNTGVPADTRRA